MFSKISSAVILKRVIAFGVNLFDETAAQEQKARHACWRGGVTWTTAKRTLLGVPQICTRIKNDCWLVGELLSLCQSSHEKSQTGRADVLLCGYSNQPLLCRVLLDMFAYIRRSRLTPVSARKFILCWDIICTELHDLHTARESFLSCRKCCKSPTSDN